MDVQKTIDALQKNGYAVQFFSTGDEAVRYLAAQLRGRTIGFGGSRTLLDLRLREVLSAANTVYDPDFPAQGETFRSTAMRAMHAEDYVLSANALSEAGEIVNLDGIGNRLAGSLFGHEKVYYVVGTNKIVPDLQAAIWRVRNVAAPKNAMRFHLSTPCALRGDRCYDCHHPDRICNSLLIHYRCPSGVAAKVLLIDEALGF